MATEKEDLPQLHLFTTLGLVVGEQVDQQNYRCQILDDAGVLIVVLRVGDRDAAFANGDAGCGD